MGADVCRSSGDLAAAVFATLQRQQQMDRRLAVAYSGGLDSTVLLHLLAEMRNQLPFKLSAVHVHHGLSPNADAWSSHCAAVCAELDIPFQTVRVQVEVRGQGIEAAARHARYRVFADIDADTVVLAHHQDDQAETVLLQLARGASLRGMAAMPELRPLTEHVQLFRPLLPFSRQQLLAYAQATGLRWIEDESNLDTAFSRNRVRHRLIPQLESTMPDIAQALVNAAGQFSEWAEMMDALALADAAGQSPVQGVSIQHMCALPEPRARNLLRFWLQEQGGQVRRQALTEAVRQLCSAPYQARTRVDFPGQSMVCSQGEMHLVNPRFLSKPGLMSLPWQGETRLDLGAAGVLDFQVVRGGGVMLEPGLTHVRFRQPGDRFQQSEKQAKRPLKDVLREARIPSWQRAWLPMLEVDGRLAWVAELGELAEFRTQPDQPGLLISWQSPWSLPHLSPSDE